MDPSVSLEMSTSTRENVFSRSSTQRNAEDDEESLKWAALQKLPTYDRMRTAIMKNIGADGKISQEEIDVRHLSYEDRQQIISKLLKVTEQDNERFLLKFRERIDRVGIVLPKIEVRFEHLNVEADVYVGNRALPTLPNFSLTLIETLLSKLHLSPSKKKRLTILHDISGILKPQRMTLLLGPPSSGKTSLLLALAGKLDKALEVSGKVTYNGHEMTEFVPERTCAYISQRDLQMGELTVRETLDFSGRCQGVGPRFEMLAELARRENQMGIKPDVDMDMFMKATALQGQGTSLMTDYILKILALDICADTLVGDDMRRGISGGQKKRVNTGEMLVGPAKALFMDEISTGLDSSTTYQIVKCLRQSVHVLDGTMLVSLLQPAPETFELFDDLILLSEGQIVYQGPRELVVDFFEQMGFRCPERKGVADFLQEVTSRKDQEQYWQDKSRPYRYVSVTEFAQAYPKFHVGEKLVEELATPFDKTKSHPAALVHERYALSKRELFHACMDREKVLMKRNKAIYIFKSVQTSIVALITMSVFFRTTLSPDSVGDGGFYLGALFFALINMMFNGFAEMALTIQRLPVFYKQRDLLFYPPWAFVLPTYLLRLPLSLYESLIWICLTYFTIGFAPEPSRFFRQWLVLFAMHQMALGLFRLIGSVTRMMIVAQTGGSFAIIVVFVLGGFIISRENIHPWWIWGFWISPLTYAQNAIAVNEFLADRWNKPPTPGPFSNAPTLGQQVLLSRGLFDRGYWYWLGIGVLLGYSILFNCLYCFFLKVLNPLGKPNTTLSKEAMDEKKANLTGEDSQSRSRRNSAALASHVNNVTANGYSNGDHNAKSRRVSRSLSRTSKARSSSARSDDAYEQSMMDANGVAPKRGMVLPFTPLSIAFHHINYFIDMPAEMKAQGIADNKLQLLNDISGAFRPGVLTALMGVSGAGKTTLMDVLAGRKTGGYIEGNIWINGHPKKQETFARISGYCEQFDIHSPNVTVHESLLYSAWLRLPKNIKPSVRKAFVEEVMELVELTPQRLALVGLPGVTGLSTEARKRLTIAVELVSNPSIIFMDEPTSGLDARAAAIVMRTVRNTVDTGRTVVCTIHQPSIDIFEAFDELLLLKRGGQVIYSGPLGHRSSKLVDYFQAVPGVPAIKEKFNPSTWMLDVTSQGSERTLGVDFADVFARSSLYQRNETLIKELSSPAPGTEDISFPTKYAQPLWEQCMACLWKQHRSYWRNPYYNVVRLMFTTVCGLVLGSIFWKLGSNRTTQQDLFNLMGAMYASVLFVGINNCSGVQPVVAVERMVFYRERAAGMYSTFPYSFAQVTIEWPYVFAQSLIYGCIVYAMIQFEWNAAKFFYFIFFMYLTLLYFTYWGMVTVAITPNAQFAAIISSAFYGLWNLFSGFLIPRPQLPVYWVWYYWITPTAWTLYGLITSQLGDVTSTMEANGSQIVVRDYLKGYFGFYHSFLPYVCVWHIGLVVLFGLVFATCIKVFNFQRR
ncbi:hypothetical protein M758_5G099800 [Ceratodon purpureus]|nr:hypothetical protein M758_5G099800 [Ceratodon purpureus]